LGKGKEYIKCFFFSMDELLHTNDDLLHEEGQRL